MKKNFGKWFTILAPIAVALVLLYPTYNNYTLEQKKSEFQKRADAAPNAIDSSAIMTEFDTKYKEDYQNSKDNALKLGLDLQGGMYVTLEVDVLKLIEEAAQREAVDDVFNEVLAKTGEDAKESEEPTMDIFLRNFDEIARPKGKSLISYFDIGDVRDASEEKIIERLKQDAEDAIDQAKEVISQRIDKYGVSEPNIQKQGTRRILLELPGVTDEPAVRKLIKTTARLEFNLVRNNQDIAKAFRKIDMLLEQQYKRKMAREQAYDDTDATVANADSVASDETQAPALDNAADTTTIAANDTTAKTDDSADVAEAKADTTNPYAGMSEDETRKQFYIDHQFTRLFTTYYVPGKDQRMMVVDYVKDVPDGEYVFYIPKDSINKFELLLKRKDIRSLIPFDLDVMLDAKPIKQFQQTDGAEIFNIWGIKKDPELTGDVVTNAVATYDQVTNAPEVIMYMNSDGADRWSRITGANIDKKIAIVLDGRIYSAPNVISRINNGVSSITGSSDIEEARLLEIVLKAGALKAPVQIIEERVVGPSLGQDSIDSGVISSIIAVLLVIVFMFLYYLRGGLVADFAVILNVTLVIAILSALGGTLTLPGIAGLILTVGMAVDANVLIFERIREELYKGRSIRSAVDEGFSKALSAILDSNITTFITGFILFYFGSGPIQGFATTLMVGILGTLFTGIVVTRAMIELSISKGADSYNFGQPKSVNS